MFVYKIIKIVTSVSYRPSNGGNYCVGEQRRYRTCNIQVSHTGWVGLSANITVVTTPRIVQLMMIVMLTSETSSVNHVVTNGSL